MDCASCNQLLSKWGQRITVTMIFGGNNKYTRRLCSEQCLKIWVVTDTSLPKPQKRHFWQ